MPNRIWVDVEDLFQYSVFNARPSGIQRIELELCRALVSMPETRDRVGFLRHAPARNGFTAIPFAAVDALDWWQGATAGPYRITATPARHFSRRGPFDGNRTLWCGFDLQGEDGHVLFAGDSGAGPHWADIQARLGPPGLALLPIGAYEPRWLMAPVHMNPAEAVQAHRDLGARQSVGMHFGTFQLTDEAIDAPVRALVETGVADFTTLGIGETRLITLRD